MKLINAGELQRQVVEKEVSPTSEQDYSPFVCWAKGQVVLYLTHESQKVWEYRLYQLAGSAGAGIENVSLAFAFGLSAGAIVQAVEEFDGSIVILDSIRFLFAEADLPDALTHLYRIGREKNQTIIFRDIRCGL